MRRVASILGALRRGRPGRVIRPWRDVPASKLPLLRNVA